MLILEIVERPLQFVIEVEVGGKWQSRQSCIHECVHNSFGYLFHHLISLTGNVEKFYAGKSICEHFYVKMKLTLKEGLDLTQLLSTNPFYCHI